MTELRKLYITDESGNIIGSSELGTKQSLNVAVLGEDGYPIQVGPDGRLHITLATPQSTTNTTKSIQTFSAAVSGHSYELFYFVIPNTQTLILSKIIIGSQEGSSCAYLYLAPNGTLDGNEELISTYYINGNTVEYDIDKEYLGDGTKAVIIKLQRLTKGKRLITLTSEGFLK